MIFIDMLNHIIVLILICLSFDIQTAKEIEISKSGTSSTSSSSGAAMDSRAFSGAVNRGKLPKEDSIVFEGVCSEHAFPNMPSSDEILEPFVGFGKDRKGNLYMGMSLSSCKDGKDRTQSFPGMGLDVVFLCDIR